MLNIIGHYENTNQNHAEITLEDGYNEKKQERARATLLSTLLASHC